MAVGKRWQSRRAVQDYLGERLRRVGRVLGSKWIWPRPIAGPVSDVQHVRLLPRCASCCDAFSSRLPLPRQQAKRPSNPAEKSTLAIALKRFDGRRNVARQYVFFCKSLRSKKGVAEVMRVEVWLIASPARLGNFKFGTSGEITSGIYIQESACI